MAISTASVVIISAAAASASSNAAHRRHVREECSQSYDSTKCDSYCISTESHFVSRVDSTHAVFDKKDFNECVQTWGATYTTTDFSPSPAIVGGIGIVLVLLFLGFFVAKALSDN